MVGRAQVGAYSAAKAILRGGVQRVANRTFLRLVRAGRVAITWLPLTIHQGHGTSRVNGLAIRVPLRVFSVNATWGYASLFVSTIPRVFSTRVGSVLVSQGHSNTSFRDGYPIQVLFMRFQVQKGRFQFRPSARFRTGLVRFVCRVIRSTQRFLFVRGPIPGAYAIVITISGPTVVRGRRFGSMLENGFYGVWGFFNVRVGMNYFPIISRGQTFLVTMFTTSWVVPVRIIRVANRFSGSLYKGYGSDFQYVG